MITVLQRPQGQILHPTAQAATVQNNFGRAMLVDTSHGLIDGDHVYVLGNVEDYNGFWQVDQIYSNAFLLRKPTLDASVTQPTVAAFNDEQQFTTGDQAWALDPSPLSYEVILGSLEDSHQLAFEIFNGIEGATYNIGYSIIFTAAGTVTVRLYDVSLAQFVTETVTSFGSGTQSGTANLTPGFVPRYVIFEASAGIASLTVNVEPFTFSVDLAESFEYVDFISETDLVYYVAITSHGWNAVHLPIVYKLLSNLSPTNNSDAERTVSSFTNDNGFVNLNLSGSLGSFEDLSFIKITGNADQDLNAVFQVLEKYSTSDITINLAYDSSYDFSSSIITLFYPAYHVVVKVYAGILSGHPWDDQKTEELAATLKLIPDENNEITFSIHEILKGYITQRNSLLLGTLPNNIDFWTDFYIKYFESYDVSTGYTITTFESDETTDTFEGVAVNISLPFKNRFSGYLSNYLFALASIYTDNQLAKWLSGFTSPRVWAGQFFDVAILINFEDAFRLKITVDGIVTYEDYTGGRGLYRFPITISGETMSLQIVDADDGAFSEILNLTIDDDCFEDSIYLTWLNNLGNFDYWLFTAEKDYLKDIGESVEAVKNIFPEWPKSFGETADTINRNTSRITKEQKIVRSQYMTLAELQAVAFIKESVIVQQVTSRQDRRTVIIDTDSFTLYRDEDQLFQIQFTLTYTNENAVQRL